MKSQVTPGEILPALPGAAVQECADSARQYFANSLEHVLSELERIHLLVSAQVKRVRQLQKADERFQGLVISEAEVDELLTRPAGSSRFATAPPPKCWPALLSTIETSCTKITVLKSESIRRGITLRLSELERLFCLDSFEIDCLLVCLAPELDLRYERLYAYLQDDVTKKRPSVDLVLNLLCPSIQLKLTQRQRFTAGAPLIKQGLLVVFEDPSQQQATLLGKFLRVDERIVNYLLESDEPDARLLPYARRIKPETKLEDLIITPETKASLALWLQLPTPPKGIVYLQGPYGVGKQTTAEAVCQVLGIGLLAVDGERLVGLDHVAFEVLARLAVREALLKRSALYWEGFDSLLAEDKRLLRNTLLGELEKQPQLSFLAGDTAWEPASMRSDFPFLRIELSRPDCSQRGQLWEAALKGVALNAQVNLPELANKFRFSGGQIRDAARSARNLARWHDPEKGCVSTAELYEACRLHSSGRLSTLGRKIRPHHIWSDIVLPEDKLEQLKEIRNSMTFRSVVYDQWGFDRKLSLGKGLNILFAGPSGTGKTMASEIMAGELGLDLYKIDLSTVVSKYIGETEKNLARIFAEAETSNAILFFDEADALFGKRSEVRDSHDRYANIEINYLLQKMEEHEGVVILATNFRKNMDDAFVRRMHFTVEFPFPNEADRHRIWEHIWPAETPQSTDLDLDFMARRFEIAGGNIRNIALSAAFLAASDGGVVSMAHLVHGTRREFQKMGKVVTGGEFRGYAQMNDSGKFRAVK